MRPVPRQRRHLSLFTAGPVPADDPFTEAPAGRAIDVVEPAHVKDFPSLGLVVTAPRNGPFPTSRPLPTFHRPGTARPGHPRPIRESPRLPRDSNRAPGTNR